MIISSEILQDLYKDVDKNTKEQSIRYVELKEVEIKKVIFENQSNFEVRGLVNGDERDYNTYIKIQNGEIENLECQCEKYKEKLGACEHIISTLLEFAENEKYIKTKKIKEENGNRTRVGGIVSKKEQYRIFKQIINAFYEDDLKTEKELKLQETQMEIIPRLLFSSYNNNLKVEFDIGKQGHYYRIKHLIDFFEKMNNNDTFKYGNKFDVIHNPASFKDEYKPLLDFIMKNAEIIKYASESADNYGFYVSNLVDTNITLSNTAIDELFEILKNKKISINIDSEEKDIILDEEEANIKFILDKASDEEYKMKSNIDIFKYEVFEGKDFIYILIKNRLHRCDKKVKNTVLKILNILKTNYIEEICFEKKELSKFCSLIYPVLEDRIDVKKLKEEEIEKLIPQKLYVKVYLDFDKNNYIVAGLKFCYGDIEFNPFIERNIDVARNMVQENEVFNLFLKSGFMLEQKMGNLILARDEDIYQFLSIDIEEYMQKFEVLATENFRKKEIKQPKISSLGVKLENNLLKIDLGDFDFDKKELKELMERYKLRKKYFRLKDGTFVDLEENSTLDFLENLTNDFEIDFEELENGEITLPSYRSLYLDKILESLDIPKIERNEDFKDVISDVQEKDLIENIKIPKTLNASLRNYQIQGYKWLKVLDSYKMGGILADDMGLGKTIQLLAVIASYNEENKEKKPTLVVCPSSLTLNWKNEIEKYVPNLSTIVIHGTLEERKTQIRDIPNYNIAITSYDLLKRDIEEYKENKHEFKFIIADEAQYIKNNNTQNAKAIKEIKAETRYALTGTPIENSLSELWSIFDFVMPDYLFGYKKFKDIFELPIIKDDDKKTMRKLKMLISPFILRRVKKDVLTELPDKTVTVLNNEMQEEQAKIYLAEMEKARKTAEYEIETVGLKKSQIKILALLMRLRQICCHPSLYIDNYEGESSKLNQCLEIIKDAIESGHKILLFSGYTSMFKIIEKELKKENINYMKLTGQTKVGERIKLVDEFNKNDDVKIFLISLKAGGTGLNLIGADMVIHYDPWWNLSAENQATDRTYRIGQKKNVQVYKLITKNSIEERIYELQQKKDELIDNMLSLNETFINKLSKEDIMKLFE